MSTVRRGQANPIDAVPRHLWQRELENTSSRYHTIAAWIAIVFDPLFALTDYINIPQNWEHVFMIRLAVAMATLATLYYRRTHYVPSHIVALVPVVLISLQNAYTYKLIANDHLLAHNLNYMALLVGAGMFVVWHWSYSVGAILLSGIATTYFLLSNPNLAVDQFFLKGGLLLIASGLFMIILIRMRYTLTLKEIKARIALQLSSEAIYSQNEEIKAQNTEILAQAETIKKINENLESLVHERTIDLERKNKALKEYAFINAHKLRSPLASILGLVNLMKKESKADNRNAIIEHLNQSATELEQVVSSITTAIDRGTKD